MSARDRPDPGRSGRREGGGPPDDAIREELDRIVLEAIPPVSAGLALLYVLLAVAHAFVLPSSGSATLVASAGASALALGTLRLTLSRWSPPPALGHPLAATVAGVVLLNGLLHLYVTGEPRQTTNLLLLILGAGIVFLDGGWFAAVVTLCLTGWVAILPTVAADAAWLHFGLALVGATVLGAAVLVIRVRTFTRIEELHFRDRMKQIELEAALARTEEARRGEREAREAVEDAVRELRESEDRFRRLANASYEGVVVQQDGEIVDANARAARLFGHRVGSLVGRSLGELVVAEDRERVEGFLRGTVEPDREAILTEGIRSTGEPFSLEVRRATATHRGREAFVGVLRDVTERVDAERMLRRAAAEAQASSRAKSSFLANMSHELRTPLNSVIGFAKILRKKAGDQLGRKEMDYVERIVANGEILLELIGDVLDLSKIEAGRMEPTTETVDVDAVVREALRAVELQARSKGLDLRAVIPDRVRTVETDPYRLRQILVNLLGNGVKFTEEGRVEVRVETDDDDRPARIHVRDTGPGIPEDQRMLIFEAFRQAESTTARRYGGTGLGLTIARSLADTLGFRLDVRSEVGEGTTFTVVLDPGPEPPTPTVTGESARAGTGGESPSGNAPPERGETSPGS